MESSLLFVEIFYSFLLLSLATHLKQRNSVSNFQFGQNASFMSIICWKYIGSQNQSSLICSITSGSESKGILKLFYYLFSASCKLIILFHLINFWTQIPIELYELCWTEQFNRVWLLQSKNINLAPKMGDLGYSLNVNPLKVVWDP